MTRLVTTPLTIGEARAFVEAKHAHHHAPKSALFAVGVSACPHVRCPTRDGKVDCPDIGLTLRCAALVGRPVARKLDQLGHVAELTRCASDRTPHVASKCIAAATRMAIAGGYTRLISYTLVGESGASYLAAGWHVTGLTNNEHGWQTRPGRDREARQGGAKVRWEYGPDALPCDSDEAVEAAIVCALSVGLVNIPERTESLPLLRSL
jgi:hypothetical protein